MNDSEIRDAAHTDGISLIQKGGSCCMAYGNRENGWRKRAYVIIFESDTPAGKWFDDVLIISSDR